MSDCIADLVALLAMEGYNQELTLDLGTRLRGEIEWVEHVAPGGTRLWEGHNGDWNFALADFPIEDQPGHSPGERGQNIGISNARASLVLQSDSAVFHAVAHRLVVRIAVHGLRNVFAGVGSVRQLRVNRLPETEQKFLLQDEASFQKAIDWMKAHIERLGSTSWVIPRNNSCLKFDAAHKTVRITGGCDKTTEMILLLMGYTLVRDDNQNLDLFPA